MSATTTEEFEDTTDEKGARFKLPKWTPSLILWASRLLVLTVAAWMVSVIVRGEIALHSMGLPWWALVVFYSAVFGVLLRLAKDGKKGWTHARHHWGTYCRWAESLV